MSALLRAISAIGRGPVTLLARLRRGLEHVSGVWHILVMAAYYSTIAPLLRRSQLRPQLAPLLRSVGSSSLPIVALVNFLTGAILVLQTGDVMQEFGQIQEVPGLVALSMTRELGPLMTAIVLTARVGASYTAVCAAMKLNEEIMALETMAIPPAAYLIAPRFLSLVIMMPCLTVLSYLIGMAGGALTANGMYDISLAFYADKSAQYLDMLDLLSGILKAGVFAMIISSVSCYYGFIARGGTAGLGRYIMVSVVTCLVVVVLADALLTSFAANYMY